MLSKIFRQFRQFHQLHQYGGWMGLMLLLSGCEAVDQLAPLWSDLESRLESHLQQETASSPEQSLPKQPSEQPSPEQSPITAAMETQVLEQINGIRQQQGLSELRPNPKLAQVARSYSQRMAEQGFFDHTSPQGDTLVDRVKAANIFYFLVGENLFTSTNIPQPVPAAIEGWMNSPGHRKNILRPEYRETGIGVWRTGNTYYFTQLFMRSI